ncbi:hypothetical protein [Engelhardtia mirabilis]|uniref:Rcc01698-like C-terminal domain-containing protein n=1 Tax=Engelhardtia mirabilis TaxID=2528011 RepID=A0A518BL68_9BACT|nr:hypothetical protein Pla133_28090 [Planctomycetes bacterium Pla133]QDV02047.1 hypothetical protein Pla86_28080 [Planctomycetes bacterium Pla86]
MTELDPFPSVYAVAVEVPDPLGPAIRVAAAVTERFTNQVGIYWTRTPGSGYRGVGATTGVGRVGRALSVLPSADPDLWDNSGEVLVELARGTLESRPTSDVERGANLAVLGGEVIAFATAALEGERTYRLSGIARGLLDTAARTGTHAIGEPFMLLDEATLRIPYHPDQWGDEVTLRAVRAGRSIADAPDFATVTLAGASALPRAPGALQATEVAGGLQVSWARRSRHRNRVVDAPAMVPLDEPFERFEIEVAMGGAPVRVETVEAATSWLYSMAMQFEDASVLATKTIRVRQLGAWGRGRPAEVEAVPA